MGAFKDKLVALSFEQEKTHTVLFDPGVEMQTLQGRNGPYDAIPVEENGKVFLLALGSARLTRKLKALGEGRKKISITRTGESFATDYEVKVVK
jgi:hypothetical protein